MPLKIPPVEVMADETFMLHMEKRHANDLSMDFKREPDREERRLRAPAEWRTFHETMHRLTPEAYAHVHNEE